MMPDLVLGGGGVPEKDRKKRHLRSRKCVIPVVCVKLGEGM